MKDKTLKNMREKIYNNDITYDNILETIDGELYRLYELAEEVKKSNILPAVKDMYLTQINQRIVSLHMAANSTCVDKKQKKEDSEPTMGL